MAAVGCARARRDIDSLSPSIRTRGADTKTHQCLTAVDSEREREHEPNSSSEKKISFFPVTILLQTNFSFTLPYETIIYIVYKKLRESPWYFCKAKIIFI